MSPTLAEFGCKGGSQCSFVGQQKVVEAKNGITEQIGSDNLQYLFALLTTASHITSHAEMSGNSSCMCKDARATFASI